MLECVVTGRKPPVGRTGPQRPEEAAYSSLPLCVQSNFIERNCGLVPTIKASVPYAMSVLLETSVGDITIDLLVHDAPKACEK